MRALLIGIALLAAALALWRGEWPWAVLPVAVAAGLWHDRRRGARVFGRDIVVSPPMGGGGDGGSHGHGHGHGGQGEGADGEGGDGDGGGGDAGGGGGDGGH